MKNTILASILSLNASAQMPQFLPNTPSYANECSSADGWEVANGTLTHESGTIALRPLSTSEATARQAAAMPIPMKDWNMEALVSCAGTKNYIALIETGQYTRKLYVYLNYNCVTNTTQQGTISLRRTNNVGANANKVAFTGIDTSTPLRISLSFDSRNNRVVLSMKDASGWRFGCHVTASWHGGDIVLGAQGTGAHTTIDYIQIASPDIQAIGDSNCNGATTFSTVISANKNDGDNQWHRWANPYPDLRNTLIVNKGVNGNTSAAVLSRLQGDVIDNHPKVVFLHACNNDYTQNVAPLIRLANITASINALTGAGIQVVLLNALYGTEARLTNPQERAYYEASWASLLEQNFPITYIDISIPLQDASGWQDPLLTNPNDGLHLNNSGAKAVGSFITP